MQVPRRVSWSWIEFPDWSDRQRAASLASEGIFWGSLCEGKGRGRGKGEGENENENEGQGEGRTRTGRELRAPSDLVLDGGGEGVEGWGAVASIFGGFCQLELTTFVVVGGCRMERTRW